MYIYIHIYIYTYAHIYRQTDLPLCNIEYWKHAQKCTLFLYKYSVYIYIYTHTHYLHTILFAVYLLFLDHDRNLSCDLRRRRCGGVVKPDLLDFVFSKFLRKRQLHLWDQLRSIYMILIWDHDAKYRYPTICFFLKECCGLQMWRDISTQRWIYKHQVMVVPIIGIVRWIHLHGWIFDQVIIFVGYLISSSYCLKYVKMLTVSQLDQLSAECGQASKAVDSTLRRVEVGLTIKLNKVTWLVSASCLASHPSF